MNVFKFSLQQKYKLLLFSLIVALLSVNTILSAVLQSSGANWIYKNGNAEGTRNVKVPSALQSLDDITIKWSTNKIAGDIQPLLGNILNTKPMTSLPHSPNEIAAVVGGRLVVATPAGKFIYLDELPPFIKGISALIDTNLTTIPNEVRNPLAIALESIEAHRDDSLAVSYLVGAKPIVGSQDEFSINVLKRFSINMRQYSPNVLASIKPIFAKRSGNSMSFYTILNIDRPSIPQNGFFTVAPYLRGVTQFDATVDQSSYPDTDVGDNLDNRITVAYDVAYGEPSVTLDQGRLKLLMPSYPSNSTFDASFENNVSFETKSNEAAFFALDITGGSIDEAIEPIAMTTQISGTRPHLENFWVDLYRPSSNTIEKYILIAEQYTGFDGSNGVAQLHLADRSGQLLTISGSLVSPPIRGANNHLWSVAVGDADGITQLGTPLYPRNQGKEIIVTQSSRDMAVPGNKLMVLRFVEDLDFPKPSPPNSFLFRFDTICTQKITGWVAATNDIDGEPDGKEEIFLVDKSKLVVLRMRDYTDTRFRFGMPFDTVFTQDFGTEAISSVAIADFDGDGKNDIVVTTHERTYVLGAIVPNAIEFVDYLDINSGIDTNFCAGQTVDVMWDNKSAYLEGINLVLYDILSGDEVLLGENFENKAGMNSYTFTVDTNLIGRRGFFALQSPIVGSSILAFSNTVSFDNPITNVNLDNPDAIYKVGEYASMTLTNGCLDSLGAEFTLDGGLSWSKANTLFGDAGIFYNLEVEIPCVDIFRTYGEDLDDGINFRLVSYKMGLEYPSTEFRLKVAPAEFPGQIAIDTTANPNKTIKWRLADMGINCDEVEIGIGEPNTGVFSPLATVNVSQEFFEWEVPLDAPESMALRVACVGSCMRTDTIIENLTPSLVNLIAPNPFRPGRENLEIVYTVPESMSVTVSIIDQGNRLIARLIENQPRQAGFAWTEVWDGLLLDGSYAANGLNYVKVEFSNGQTEIYPVFVRK